MKTGFIPIDDRPVCYTLPQRIAAVNKNIELFLPEREWLGNLTKSADIEKILEWLAGLPELDSIIISLDTAAYGGLIPSRRCEDSFEEIYARLEKLKQILKEKNAEIYAFSSIMRISDNNINEEEKGYWAQWGKKIFEYSYKEGRGKREQERGDIPQEILEDYLGTRKRNFEINKIYLEWQKEGLFNTLVYSKDDCAPFGFNVREARELEALGGAVKTGADEIPLALLARACTHFEGMSIKIAPIFLEPDQKHLISNYEDISIEQSVKGQIELAGCEVCEPVEADLLLYVNNFTGRQGEIVMGVSTAPFAGGWQTPDKPYMIADVRFANGADNAFIEKLFTAGLGDKFYGYAAWNTSANTLGSLICAAAVKFCALNFEPDLKLYDNKSFKRLQLVRFLDDWAYQANVRQNGKSGLSDISNLLASDYEPRVFKALDIYEKISYNFPWNRLFEIEVKIEPV
ncbi:MAG: DUF4127 family protein [Heliobacteriaceae bacterium]|jgi:hypothetical protein|nr:DUF4127 family protein [Heliobacteriaceae bacterium]